jgi:acetyltransferase-like isoleucine patch superfamily enzyme
MQKLKTLYWELRFELEWMFLVILMALPLRFGQWARSCLLRFFLKSLGRNTVFQSGARIFSPENVSVGSNCNFAQDIFITGGGGVTIGDWVGFGPDVKVWSVNHRFEDPDTPWLLQGHEAKAVVIEDDVWLAAGVFVMPGVTIGRGAIVSAYSVVNKSLPPYALASGNPARVVGWRKAPVQPATAADKASKPRDERVVT